jgi:hypothetical protein
MRRTYLTHLKNGPINDKATTQRTNYPFNSFCEFDGVYIAASSTGLFRLGGETDNGTPIDAYFAIIQTNFGSSSSKRMQAVNLSYTSPGSLYAELTPDEGTAIQYTITGAFSGVQRRKTKVAEKPKGVFWKYKFGNVVGAYFMINRIDVDMFPIEHGNINY